MNKLGSPSEAGEFAEKVTTITLSAEGIVLESTIHVVTESGQKVVVSSRRTTVVDVLDSFPSGLN